MVTTARTWLTVPEVARRLSIGRERAYQLVKEGDLPAKKLGPRRIRVSEEDLIAWVNAHDDVVPGEAVRNDAQ